MIVGSLLPYVGRRFSARPEGLFGRNVAQEGLLRELLCGGHVAGVDIFATTLLPRLAEGERAACQAAADEAFGGSARKPEFHLLSELPFRVRRDDYAFITSVPDAPRLGQVRSGSFANSFGITAIVHAVRTADMLATHAALALTLTEADFVVVTSPRSTRSAKSSSGPEKSREWR